MDDLVFAVIRSCLSLPRRSVSFNPSCLPCSVQTKQGTQLGETIAFTGVGREWACERVECDYDRHPQTPLVRPIARSIECVAAQTPTLASRRPTGPPRTPRPSARPRLSCPTPIFLSGTWLLLTKRYCIETVEVQRSRCLPLRGGHWGEP